MMSARIRATECYCITVATVNLWISAKLLHRSILESTRATYVMKPHYPTFSRAIAGKSSDAAVTLDPSISNAKNKDLWRKDVKLRYLLT